MPKANKSSFEAFTVQRTARWFQIPPPFQKAFKDGLVRLKKAYIAIGEAAKAPCLPPIRIVDIGWVRPGYDGAIFAKAWTTFQQGRRLILGITLPITTVVFVDDARTLRSILVHEMSHYFHLLMAMARYIHEGSSGPLNLSASGDRWDDQEADLKALVTNLDDWLGEVDCTDFLSHWADSRLDPPTDHFMSEWAEKGLPIEVPKLGFQAGDKPYVIPGGLMEFAEGLLAKETICKPALMPEITPTETGR